MLASATNSKPTRRTVFRSNSLDPSWLACDNQRTKTPARSNVVAARMRVIRRGEQTITIQLFPRHAHLVISPSPIEDAQSAQELCIPAFTQLGSCDTLLHFRD